MRLIAAAVLAATLAGCSTYRWDVAGCADIGLWGQPPPGCYCPDRDYACYELSRRAGIVDQAASLHIQSPEVGRRDIVGDVGHVVTHVDPSARGSPSPDTARWVQAADPKQAEIAACWWRCWIAPSHLREGCDCGEAMP